MEILGTVRWSSLYALCPTSSPLQRKIDKTSTTPFSAPIASLESSVEYPLRLERQRISLNHWFSRSGWPLPPFVLTFTTTLDDDDALPASTAPENLPINSLRGGVSFPTL